MFDLMGFATLHPSYVAPSPASIQVVPILHHESRRPTLPLQKQHGLMFNINFYGISSPVGRAPKVGALGDIFLLPDILASDDAADKNRATSLYLKLWKVGHKQHTRSTRLVYLRLFRGFTAHFGYFLFKAIRNRVDYDNLMRLISLLILEHL